jgi:hypothetical protein
VDRPPQEQPDRPEHEVGDAFRRFADRRRQKIRAEIERNRRGEYTVPTWVLVVALALLLTACLAIYLL